MCVPVRACRKAARLRAWSDSCPSEGCNQRTQPCTTQTHTGKRSLLSLIRRLSQSSASDSAATARSARSGRRPPCAINFSPLRCRGHALHLPLSLFTSLLPGFVYLSLWSLLPVLLNNTIRQPLPGVSFQTFLLEWALCRLYHCSLVSAGRLTPDTCSHVPGSGSNRRGPGDSPQEAHTQSRPSAQRVSVKAMALLVCPAPQLGACRGPDSRCQSCWPRKFSIAGGHTDVAGAVPSHFTTICIVLPCSKGGSISR